MKIGKLASAGQLFFDVNNVQSFVSQFVYAVSISIKIVIV